MSCLLDTEILTPSHFSWKKVCWVTSRRISTGIVGVIFSSEVSTPRDLLDAVWFLRMQATLKKIQQDKARDDGIILVALLGVLSL